MPFKINSLWRHKETLELFQLREIIEPTRPRLRRRYVLANNRHSRTILDYQWSQFDGPLQPNELTAPPSGPGIDEPLF